MGTYVLIYDIKVVYLTKYKADYYKPGMPCIIHFDVFTLSFQNMRDTVARALNSLTTYALKTVIHAIFH